MKRFLLLSLTLLSALAAPAATPARKVTGEALGAVRYEANYIWGAINTKVADATITLERSKWNGSDVLHSRATISATPFFRLFMNADYLADAYLSPATLEPVYYVNPFKKGGKDGKVEYTFDHAAKLVKSEAVRPPAAPEQAIFPLDGKTMDLLSLLQYVRFLDMGEGKSEPMHVLMSGKSVSATLHCEGADPEKFPDKSALRFRLEMVERGLMENGSGKVIVVWRSTADDRRILALEAALSTGSMTVSIQE